MVLLVVLGGFGWFWVVLGGFGWFRVLVTTDFPLDCVIQTVNNWGNEVICEYVLLTFSETIMRHVLLLV